MPSHAWQWTNEELELFIGNFGGEKNSGWLVGWGSLGLVGLGLGFLEILVRERSATIVFFFSQLDFDGICVFFAQKLRKYGTILASRSS